MLHALALWLTAAWAFWMHTLAPDLSLFVIPSLITALTPYPKEQGVVAKLQRLLQLLSVMVHWDSPGTMKPPLTFCRPPTVKGAQLELPRAGGQAGRASLTALLAALALGITTLIVLAWGGCATVKPILTDLATCSQANVASAVGDISATVTAILESGGASWKSQLAGLALTVGKTEVACAVAEAIAHLQAALPEHGEAAPQVTQAIIRGKVWLAQSGAK